MKAKWPIMIVRVVGADHDSTRGSRCVCLSRTASAKWRVGKGPGASSCQPIDQWPSSLWTRGESCAFP